MVSASEPRDVLKDNFSYAFRCVAVCIEDIKSFYWLDVGHTILIGWLVVLQSQIFGLEFRLCGFEICENGGATHSGVLLNLSHVSHLSGRMLGWIRSLFQKRAPKKGMLWVLIDYNKWNGLPNFNENRPTSSNHIQHIEGRCREYFKAFKIPVTSITYSTERPARRSDGFWVGLNETGFGLTLEF
jgi:hypothetical protein